MTKLLDVIESAPGFFASTYAEARALFRDACVAKGLSLHEYLHPLKGPDGEALAIDVAFVGPADAGNLLVVIAGTHGAEGLAGSGCQVAWVRLHEATDLPPDTAVLLIHTLNPWGCAWGRRQTEDNVDLNRNFCDFDALPDNPLYEVIHDIVVSPAHVVRAADDRALAEFRANRGDAALAAALFSGQYQHSDGVGFGGSKATWSNDALHVIVGRHAMAAKRIVVLDIHTGLGPFGYGTLLSAEPPSSAALRRARAYFGPGVVAVAEDASVPYKIHGNLLNWFPTAVAAEVTCVAIEFGTDKIDRLLELQVDDCRLHNFHDAWVSLSRLIRSDLVNFFFPATNDWMQSVVLRTMQMMHLAVRGMQYAVTES